MARATKRLQRPRNSTKTPYNPPAPRCIGHQSCNKQTCSHACCKASLPIRKTAQEIRQKSSSPDDNYAPAAPLIPRCIGHQSCNKQTCIHKCCKASLSIRKTAKVMRQGSSSPDDNHTPAPSLPLIPLRGLTETILQHLTPRDIQACINNNDDWAGFFSLSKFKQVRFLEADTTKLAPDETRGERWEWKTCVARKYNDLIFYEKREYPDAIQLLLRHDPLKVRHDDFMLKMFITQPPVEKVYIRVEMFSPGTFLYEGKEKRENFHDALEISVSGGVTWKDVVARFRTVRQQLWEANPGRTFDPSFTRVDMEGSLVLLDCAFKFILPVPAPRWVRELKESLHGKEEEDGAGEVGGKDLIEETVDDVGGEAVGALKADEDYDMDQDW